ncbi:MAG: hypothetical protein AB7N70_12660 [Dehalococcoidia bacterium]
MGSTPEDIRESARLRQAISVAARRGDAHALRKARKNYETYKARKEVNQMAATAADRRRAAAEEAKCDVIANDVTLTRHDLVERTHLREVEAILTRGLALVQALIHADETVENPIHVENRRLVLANWPTSETA